MRYRFFVTTAAMAMGLAACGAEADAPSDVDDAAEETIATDAEASKSGGFDTIEAANEAFDENYYSIDDAMNNEVFGLRFAMTREDVRAALEAKGFEPDTRKISLGYAVGRNEAELGMPDTKRVEPGKVQKRALAWFRMPDGVAYEDLGPLGKPYQTVPGIEMLRPFFYYDRDGTQRLIGFEYDKRLPEPVDPASYAPTIVEALGEPTRQAKMGTGGVYLFQLPIPAGYEPDHNVIWQSGQTLYPVKRRRASCLTAMRGVAEEQLPEGCDQVLDGDAAAQRLHESVWGNSIGRLNMSRDSGNQYMNFQITPEILRIVAWAKWLPRIISYERQEQELLAEAAEKRARIGRQDAAPEGL